MKLNIIVAYCKNKGIGYNNRIPWNLRDDLKYFKYITSNTENVDKINAVIMGRKTWESIGKIHLKGRINIVVSNTLNDGKNIHIQKSFEEAVEFIKNNYDDCVENIFAIGGENIYRKALIHPDLKNIYITEIMNNFQCDVYFPYFDEKDFNKSVSDDFKVENEIVFCRNIFTKK